MVATCTAVHFAAMSKTFGMTHGSPCCRGLCFAAPVMIMNRFKEEHRASKIILLTFCVHRSATLLHRSLTLASLAIIIIITCKLRVQLPDVKQGRSVLSCKRVAVQECDSSMAGPSKSPPPPPQHTQSLHIILTGHLPAIDTDLPPLSMLTLTQWLVLALHRHAQPTDGTGPPLVQHEADRHSNSPILGLPFDPELVAQQAPVLGLPSSVDLLPRLPASLQQSIQEWRPSSDPPQLLTTFPQVRPSLFDLPACVHSACVRRLCSLASSK